MEINKSDDSTYQLLSQMPTNELQ